MPSPLEANRRASSPGLSPPGLLTDQGDAQGTQDARKGENPRGARVAGVPRGAAEAQGGVPTLGLGLLEFRWVERGLAGQTPSAETPPEPKEFMLPDDTTIPETKRQVKARACPTSHMNIPSSEWH